MEFFGWALANVGVAVSDEALSVLIVDWQSVALDVFLVDFAAKPLQILPDAVIENQGWLLDFWVSVFEAQNEFAIIDASVLVTQKDGSCGTQMQHAVRVWRKSGYNLLVFVGVWQRRKFFFFGFFFLLGFRPFFLNNAFCSARDKLLTSFTTALIMPESSFTLDLRSALSPRILPTMAPACALPSCETALSRRLCE